MALTMVHLLVADRWARSHPEMAASPEFFLGAVSPDAIHVRDHDDKSHKDEIHLGNWQSPHPERVIAYWREHATPFDIGYGVHVLTDCQWVPRYARELRGLFQPDGKLNIKQYYNDTFRTDFQLLAETPRLNEILDMLARAEAPTNHPLLTRYEFSEWNRIILEAYRGECPAHEDAKYVTEAFVRNFVNDSTAMIDEVYKEVFQ